MIFCDVKGVDGGKPVFNTRCLNPLRAAFTICDVGCASEGGPKGAESCSLPRLLQLESAHRAAALVPQIFTRNFSHAI